MLLSSITIKSNDDLYEWVVLFLLKKGYMSKSMTLLKAQVKKDKVSWWNWRVPDENKVPVIDFLPGPGTHRFVYKGIKIWAFH